MATLQHQVWIDAPIARVYAAIASAEGFSQWWSPHTRSDGPDGEVISHDPGGEHGVVRMKVIERVPDQRMVLETISTHPAQSPASGWQGTRLVFDLDERDNPSRWRGIDSASKRLTVLEFRHEGWNADSPYFGFCNYAWGQVLAMLQRHCEAK